MPCTDLQLYLAKWVLPITAAPIHRGGIAVAGGKIALVGSESMLRTQFPHAPVRDFGQAALLPGFVNVHSHLELTGMRGFLEDSSFVNWLARLTRVRSLLSGEDLLESARAGVCEAIRSGQTTVADVGTSQAGFEALCQSGQRGIFFQEVFGLRAEDAQESLKGLKRTVKDLRSLGASTSFVAIGVSPHSAYTVAANVFRSVTEYAVTNGLPVCIHAAESQAEDDFVRRGRGGFGEIYNNRGIPWSPPRTSTIRYLSSLGVLTSKPLLIHCVKVDDEDIHLIADSGSKIAHCPKSNAKLGHGIAPLLDFLRARIPVGLGTDSVVSNNVCDMISEARFCLLLHRAKAAEARRTAANREYEMRDARCEMRELSRDPHHASLIRSEALALTADKVLELATLGGARALSMDDRIGSLEPGKEADFIVINLSRLHTLPVYDPIAAIVFSARADDVIFTVVGGRILFDGKTVETIDEERTRARLGEIAEQIIRVK